MADIVFNIAKGRLAAYADLALTNDAFKVVLLKAAGLVSDATMRDYTTLAAVLAGASDEADFGAYARSAALAGVAAVVDQSGDVVNITATAPAAWTATGASQAIGAALIVYDDDTTGGTDANIVPLAKFDCVITFDVGVPATIAFHASGPMFAS